MNSGTDNLEEVLYSPENQQQLVPLGPRVVHQSIKGRKVVDTEDVQKRCLAQDDGTLVTEQKKTTEHEEFYDQDLPEKDDHSTGSQEQIQTTVSNTHHRIELFTEICFQSGIITTILQATRRTESRLCS